MRPNIVLITVDSLRADFVGHINSKEKNTPFLDRLARKSTTFTNAIAPGIPTFFYFPSLMTGKLPFTYGHKLGIDDSDESITIAQALRENGYKTIAVLADNPMLYSLYNFDRGFDVYEDGQERKTESVMFFINAIWKLRSYIPAFVADMLEYIRAALTVLAGSPSPHMGGKQLNEKIKRTLSTQGSEPFFLWAHYQDVHYPYTNGIGHLGFGEKVQIMKEISIAGRTMKIRSPKVVEQIKDVYRKSVAFTDQTIEELYSFVSAKFSNTVFIITSDHGEAFMEHGMYYHEPYALYDELLKIPLLISSPDKKTKRVSNVVSTVSLAKTIGTIAKISTSPFKGTDLLHVGSDDPINHISKILHKCRAPSIRFQIFDNKKRIPGFSELLSYTTDAFKYILEVESGREEYYDLIKDPHETTNRIRSISKEQVTILRNKMRLVRKQ